MAMAETEFERELLEDGADPEFTRLKKWIEADFDEAVSIWRKRAREDHGFVHGDQWSERDKNFLKQRRRPAVTFNKTAPVVRAVAGAIITARSEVTFKGRGLEDHPVSEVINEGARWFRDVKDAEDEELQASEDAVTAGLGWTETRLDYDDNPDGDPYVEHIDPFEMGWDHTARKRAMEDARRLWRAREMPRSEARAMFPGSKPWEVDAFWISRRRELDMLPVDREKSRRYESTEDELSRELWRDDDVVTVVHIQWWEREWRFLVPDPQTGETAKLTEREAAELYASSGGTILPRERVKQRVFREAFLGAKMLKKGRSPVDAFTWTPFTGFYDRVKREWYGLVAPMRDPQMWANKALSQTLHILNSTAKGGVMVEEGAVIDKNRFLESWAKQDEVTYLADGSLAQNRIREKPVTPFPAGFWEVMQHAERAIRDATGVSLEMMGMREATQAGVVEQARREQGMIMLAPFFNGARHYRKRQGRVMLEVIQRFIDARRLSRILGPEYPPELVQAALTADIEYDIVVDEAPTSPNLRETVWQTLVPMWSSFPPQVQAALFAYFPGPERVTREIQQAYQQALQPPPPPPPEVQQAQMQQMHADIRKTASETVENAAKAAKDRAEAQAAEVESALRQVEAFMPQPAPQPVNGGAGPRMP